MEENVKKAAEAVEEKKPSYEQLKNWLDQLMTQRNQLAERLNQITDIMNKLPWLFKVIENREVFEPSVVDTCANEVVEILFPPMETASNTEEKPKDE